MTYAVIENGGRQYKVSPGNKLALDLNRAKVGDDLRLDKVLLIGGDDEVKLGTPFVPEASVTATVLGEAKGKKIIVFKRKRRKNYRRTRGHRQEFTVVEIKSIDIGKKAPLAAKTAETKAEVQVKPEPKTATKTKVKDGS